MTNLQEEKEIRLLSREELPYYSLLGEAVGEDLAHCAYLGATHCENFWDRVCGYRIEETEMSNMINSALATAGINKNGPTHISVSFYEKRKYLSTVV